MKTAQFIVGIIFLAAVALLLYFTVIISDIDLRGKRQVLKVAFADAGGISEGAKVMVMGMERGKVKKLEYLPRKHVVMAKLQMQEKVVLYKNYRIEIRPSSVLGGTQVWIDVGDFEKQQVKKDVYQGHSAEALMEGFDRLTEKLNQIAEKINKGEGTLAKLINNPDLYDEAERIIKEFRELVEDQREHAPVSAFTSMFGAF